jgi:hypothetical protein
MAGRVAADLTNQVFGFLRVLRRTFVAGENCATWLVRCERKLADGTVCGTEKGVSGGNLRNGETVSCGCYRKSVKTHGMCVDGTRTTEYSSWSMMVQRGTNARLFAAKNYSGRGVRVCDGFMDFRTFLSVMGNKPTSKHSIDRKDNNGNYSCGQCEECKKNNWSNNCRWATVGEQSRNTSRTIMLTHNGRTQCVADWANELGISATTIYSRVASGRSIEESLLPVPQHLRRPRS